MDQRLLVISPVRNEGAHIERVALAMAAQTRRPDAWVVVDDASTDETPEVLARLAPQLPFMRVIRPDSRVASDVKDRLAEAAEVKAFDAGLNSVDWRSFTHIAKLDGDIELPPEYFEQLLGRFAATPQLGLAGGIRYELEGDRRRMEKIPTGHHVPGALKCYSTQCFVAIGGMQDRLGWDTIDEVMARMRGFETRTFPELVALHHRMWGSADGILRGRARHGLCAYIVHYPLPWVALRALKTSAMPPWGLSGLAYLGGYVGAGLRSAPRVEDPAFRAFIRGELRSRARTALSVRRPGRLAEHGA